MKLTNTQNKAFTLVELIVVITILAILGTISFISFRGYSKNARDSVRLRDIKTIESSLELYQVKVGNYPEPTAIASVTYSGATVWDQGTFGAQTFTNVGKLNKLPLDPLTEIEYTYSLLNTKNQYELASIMENDITAYSVIPETNAADKKTNLTIIGNYNGQIAKVSTGSTTYILAVPSLITSSTGSLDLLDIVTNNNLAYKGYSNLPRNYAKTAYELTGETTPLNLVNPGNLVIYSSGSLSDLTNTDNGARLSMLQNLQDAYSGTELENNTNFSQLLSISDFTDTNTQAINLVAGIVNNYLGGKIGLTASTTSSSSSSSKLYVEDVFSTYLYTGNGGTQTIENGIDLENKGGMVWTKGRNSTWDNYFIDTERGALNKIVSNSTDAELSYSNSITGFNTDGYSLGSATGFNTNTHTYSSWTFREASKFFDIVKWTGNGVSSRDIVHNLGSNPGMILIKSTSTTDAWYVWHKNFINSLDDFMKLNETTGLNNSVGLWGNHTDTNINLGTAGMFNMTGENYVAYIFAHDPSDDGKIQCGDFTTDGSGNANVNLGWEPQWAITKITGIADPWRIADSMRGMTTLGSPDKYLFANSSDTEGVTTSNAKPYSKGFYMNFNSAGAYSNREFIYCAIRKPMKKPSNSSEVFNILSYTGNNDNNRIENIGFEPDFFITRPRTTSSAPGAELFDRLRGGKESIRTATTDAAYVWSNYFVDFDKQKDVRLSAVNDINVSGVNALLYSFKRAPGFFDMVSYKGDGVAGRTVNHNLGVKPEMMWVKSRDRAEHWQVYHADVDVNGEGDGTSAILLSSNSAAVDTQAIWANTPTDIESFTVGYANSINDNEYNYIAYLFATLPGISKVGLYTGDGTNGKVINAGFSTGAKYIMIKRTDSAGDWLFWDSERGIVDGNDPHISLNTTDTEVISDDSVDPNNGGFVVNQNGTTNINVSGGEYIYYSISK